MALCASCERARAAMPDWLANRLRQIEVSREAARLATKAAKRETKGLMGETKRAFDATNRPEHATER